MTNPSPTRSTPDILRPLPIRITQRQYDRLRAHRLIDSLAIQEHVRRALDLYLDVLDRKRERELVADAEGQIRVPALQAQTSGKAGEKAKVVYR